GVLLVKAPDSIRLEALSPLGQQPLALVVIHEGQLTAYDVAKNAARIGPATAETIAREVGLPLEPDDLVAVLAGRAAPPRDLRTAELLPADGSGPSLDLDRKSTRLNSSHVAISYAVFCLKKKN